jgi:hypothetical protein
MNKADRSKLSFPECAEDCSIMELLGVGECENVCLDKFDEDGNPIDDSE